MLGVVDSGPRKAEIAPRCDQIRNRGWKHSTHEIWQNLGFASLVPKVRVALRGPVRCV